MSRTPRTALIIVTARRRGVSRSLLRHGHDDLRLAGGLQEVAEAHDRCNQCRLGALPSLNAPSAVMPPSKPVSTDCRRNPAGPLNITATSPAFTRFWGMTSSSTPSPSRSTARGVTLDLVELREGRPRAEGVLLLDLHVAASHGCGRAPQLLALRGDLEPVVFVDEGERASVLPRDIAEGGSHGPEGRWHADGFSTTTLPFLMITWSAWPGVKNAVWLYRCAHSVFLTPSPLRSTAKRKSSTFSTRNVGLPFLTAMTNEFIPTRSIVAIAHDLERAVTVDVGELDGDRAAEEAHRFRPLGLDALLDDLVHVDLVAVADHQAGDPVRRRHRHIHGQHREGEPGHLTQWNGPFTARVAARLEIAPEQPGQERSLLGLRRICRPAPGREPGGRAPAAALMDGGTKNAVLMTASCCGRAKKRTSM